MNNNIIIIGGGASALMLASLLPKNKATIIESNNKIGAKLLISGGGKCNITNTQMSTEYFLAERSFIEPLLNKFDEKSLLDWLKCHGLIPELRNNRQYFCKSSAKEIVNIFEKKVKHQKLLLNEKVIEVSKKGNLFTVLTNKRKLTANCVVVASGGLSFPKLGASCIGYDIAEKFGHNIIKLAPALVGLTVQKEQFFFKELSGISTNVHIYINNKKCEGSLLFTHKGISGPAVLDTSLYWSKGQIRIDFLPTFLWESVIESKKKVSTILAMPKRVTKAFLVQLGVQDKQFNQLTLDELKKLKLLNHYTFAPAGTFGYSKAEVTKGGVDTSEIDNRTMMSKRVNNLFFLGEVVDVTGHLGGYNLQWAFSSAYQCSIDIDKYK